MKAWSCGKRAAKCTDGGAIGIASHTCGVIAAGVGNGGGGGSGGRPTDADAEESRGDPPPLRPPPPPPYFWPAVRIGVPLLCAKRPLWRGVAGGGCASSSPSSLITNAVPLSALRFFAAATPLLTVSASASSASAAAAAASASAAAMASARCCDRRQRSWWASATPITSAITAAGTNVSGLKQCWRNKNHAQRRRSDGVSAVTPETYAMSAMERSDGVTKASERGSEPCCWWCSPLAPFSTAEAAVPYKMRRRRRARAPFVSLGNALPSPTLGDSECAADGGDTMLRIASVVSVVGTAAAKRNSHTARVVAALLLLLWGGGGAGAPLVGETVGTAIDAVSQSAIATRRADSQAAGGSSSSSPRRHPSDDTDEIEVAAAPPPLLLPEAPPPPLAPSTSLLPPSPPSPRAAAAARARAAAVVRSCCANLARTLCKMDSKSAMGGGRAWRRAAGWWCGEFAFVLLRSASAGGETRGGNLAAASARALLPALLADFELLALVLLPLPLRAKRRAARRSAERRSRAAAAVPWATHISLKKRVKPASISCAVARCAAAEEAEVAEEAAALGAAAAAAEEEPFAALLLLPPPFALVLVVLLVVLLLLLPPPAEGCAAVC